MLKSKKLLLLISLSLFAFFIFYSFLVSKELFTKLDFDTTVRLQDKIPHKFDYPFSVFSLIGSLEITGIIWSVIFIFLLLKRYFLTALSLFLLPLALLMELFGKVFLYHPGPPFFMFRGVIKFDFPSHFIQTDYSYPSGHVTRTAFIIVFLITYIYLKPSFKKGLLPIVLLSGFLFTMLISRIYLGEHWTTDVIGGFLIGTSFGVLSAITIPSKSGGKPLDQLKLH